MTEPADGHDSLQGLVQTWPARGERLALALRSEFGVRSWSYARLYREVLHAAERLRSAGVGPGDRVAICASNCPEWVAALFGIWQRNAIAVLIDQGSSLEHVRHCLRESAAGWLLCGPELPRAPFATSQIRVLALASEFAAPAVPPPGESPHPAKRSDPAAQLFTSGTTMASKRVTLSHGNLLAQVQGHPVASFFLRLIPIRILALSPLSHSQGLVMGALVPLAVGLSVVQSASNQPLQVLRAIREERVTLLLAVPGLQHALIEHLRTLTSGYGARTVADEQGLSNFMLRRHRLFLATRRHFGFRFSVLLVGGATLAPADERFWFDCGYVLVQGYGLTETAALVSYSISNPFRWRGGSLGRELPMLDTLIAPDGELLVRGPVVAAGECDENGYLHTGDLVERDRDGTIRFLGRSKEIIVTTEGENVNPLRVERVLLALPGVRDAAVIGLSHAGRDRVHAVLLLEPGMAPEPLVLQANESLEPWERIASWERWAEEDFPRGLLGKVKRHEIRRAVSEGSTRSALGEPAPPATQALPSLQAISALPSAEQRVAELARYVAAGQSAAELTSETLSTRFALKSLDVMALLVAVERLTGRALEGSPLGTGQLTLAPAPFALDRDPVAGSAPRWAVTRAVQQVRSLLCPSLLPRFFRSFAEVEVTGLEHLRSITPPYLFAALPHEHGSDVLLIHAALPRAMRARLMFIGSAWTFREAEEQEVPWTRRALIAFALKGLIPALMPFVLLPRSGDSRNGLLEISRLMQLGYNPIVFPQGTLRDPKGPHASYDLRPGVSLIAEATGATVIPVALWGNEDFSFQRRKERARMYVHFAEPVEGTVGLPAAAIQERVATAIEHLRSRGYCPPAATNAECQVDVTASRWRAGGRRFR
jgi:long-chain acyl-CoA synthetase